MDVHAHTATLRDRARLTRTATASATASQLDWDLSWDVDRSVTAGDRVFGSLDLSVTGAVNIGDPDYCVATQFENGLRIDVELRAAGARIKTDTFCLPTESPLFNKEYSRTLDFEFVASRPGALDLEVTITGGGSQRRFEVDRETVTVREPDAADDSGNGGGGGGGGNGGGNADVVSCPDGFYYDEAAKACLPDSTGGDSGGGGGGPPKPCTGLVDALTRPECDFNTYFQNAGQGALLGMGALGLAFFALAAN